MATYQSRLTPLRRRNPILQYIGGFIVGVMMALGICFALDLLLGGTDFVTFTIGGVVFPILGMVLGMMGALTVARSQRY